MGLDAAQWSLVIAIFSLSVAVCCALACWRLATRFTRDRKWLRGLALTKTSDAKLAEVRVEQAELFSTLAKLTTTVTRLSSRIGMQDVRARQSSNSDPPPPGTSKAELRKYYAVAGKTPAEIARMHASTNVTPINTNEE